MGLIIRLLVCGSRHWSNEKAIRKQLQRLPKNTIIIHGAQKRWDSDERRYTGADYLAGEIAKELGFKVEEYPADWDRFGKKDGMLRNKQMLEEGKPDRIIAFTLDLSTSNGTRHMVGLGFENEIPTRVFDR